MEFMNYEHEVMYESWELANDLAHWCTRKYYKGEMESEEFSPLYRQALKVGSTALTVMRVNSYIDVDEWQSMLDELYDWQTAKEEALTERGN